VAAGLVTALLVGCSMIVPDDVPTFRCTGSDPTSCPSGLVCDGVAGMCVTASAAPDGGDDGEVDEGGVDGGGDSDAPIGPAPVGADCISDGDCAAGLLCGTSTLLTTAIVPAGSKPFCTRTCCRSADCAVGFVCFPGGTGGNYCVAAKKANRTPPASGGKTGGQTCTDHDDCRSGLCTTGRCVDTCCDPDQCAAGSTCRIATVNTHVGWACAPANGGAAVDLGAACGGPGNIVCKNDNCVQPFSTGPRCTPPCCRASDCTALGFANNVCAYGQAGTDNLKWCFEPNGSGKANGQLCASNADCASRYCDAELGRCANVCCTSADCSAGESCRPSPDGTPFLRCVRN
jgi:hypothetical protein